MQTNKFPPNLMFLLYGTGFIALMGGLLGKTKLSSNRLLDFYNKKGYTIYLYQNIGFAFAANLFSPLFFNTDSIVMRVAITIATWLFLLVFHALLAGAVEWFCASVLKTFNRRKVES